MDRWVRTRPIWNQHTYHITNINDDGTIPAVEDDNWLSPAGDPFNNYRQNVQDEGIFNAPDAVVSLLVDCVSPPLLHAYLCSCSPGSRRDSPDFLERGGT